MQASESGSMESSHSLGELVREGRGEKTDIVPALAQWRQLDRKDVEPVIEILAEFSFLRCLLKIPIGGGDDANVDLLRPRAAHRLKLPFLKDAEQLHLKLYRQLPISSRKIVPPSARAKRPSRFFVAPVKAPCSWPNNSLSIRVAGIAAQLTLINGFSRRWLFL